MNKPRKVVRYDEAGNALERFDSIREAQEKYGCTHISLICRGRRLKEHGLYWGYEGEEPPLIAKKRQRERELEELEEQKRQEALRRQPPQ